jgi:adenosyl cobinamide kinase/adenosyl cobinamide phosphate guanylyltransferase
MFYKIHENKTHVIPGGSLLEDTLQRIKSHKKSQVKTWDFRNKLNKINK